MNAKTLITLALVGGAGYLLAVKMGWFDGLDILPASTTDEAAAKAKAAADAAAADAAAKAAAAAAAAASGDAAAAAALKLSADKAAADAAAAKVASDKAAADQAAAVKARAEADKLAEAAKAALDSFKKYDNVLPGYTGPVATGNSNINIDSSPSFRAMVLKAAAGDRTQAGILNSISARATADEWNYYRNLAGAGQTTADLFPANNRSYGMTASEYLDRRELAGLSGFRGLAAWAPTSPRLVRGVPRGSINYRRAAQGRRFAA